jgi:hypothetical protein
VLRLRLRIFTAFVAFAILSVGIATAAIASLDDLTGLQLLPSGAPSLLGPITELGRTGWDCHPEKAATAGKWRDAELPSLKP